MTMDEVHMIYWTVKGDSAALHVLDIYGNLYTILKQPELTIRHNTLEPIAHIAIFHKKWKIKLHLTTIMNENVLKTINLKDYILP